MHGVQFNACFIGLSHSCIDLVASARSIMHFRVFLYAYMHRLVYRRDGF